MAENDNVRLALPPGLPNGLYVVNYRVTSADGHPVACSFTFGIGVTPPATTATPAVDDPSRPAALAGLLLWAVHYVALLAGTSAGLFLVLVTGRWAPLNDRLKPGLCLMLLAAGLSGALLVGVTGVTLTGSPLSDLLTGAPWTTGAASSIGLSAGFALLGLLCSACGLALDTRAVTGPALVVTGALLGAASLAATGHAATASPRWLSTPLVGLHGLMAAYWIGALWPLTMVLRLEPPADAVRLVRRFSRLAVGAVALLFGAGTALLLTAAFALTPPPCALYTGEEKPPAGFFAVAVKSGTIALIDIVPAKPGRNSVRLHLLDEDGTPVSAREVTMDCKLPAAGVAPLRHTLSSLGPGFFSIDDMTLPLAGQWSVRLDVLVDDFDKRIFRTEVPVGEAPSDKK